MSEGSKGNGKVPPWLAALGVKKGEYFIDSKLRAKRAMQSRCFSRAARVHICLGLHTMGFQQELAVKLEATKRVPIGTSDIANETRLHKQNVRPALMELRAAGLADVKGSTKGRIEILAWAIPRPVSQKNGNSRNYHFEGAPSELQSLLRRFKISLPPDFVPSGEYLSAVKDAARRYQNAEMVLKAALKGNRASEPPNKEERNERNIERNIERNTPSSSKRIDIPEQPTTTISDPLKSSPRPEPRTIEVIREAGRAAAPSVTRLAPADFQKVLDAVGQYATPDREGVRTMIARCQANTPDVTTDEIVAALHTRGPTARNQENPFGYLIHFVPKFDFARLREEGRVAAERDGREERRQRQEWEEIRAQLRATLADPHASEEDKAFARRMLEADTPGG